MTTNELVEILKGSDLLPYEIARAVSKVIKNEVKERVEYSDIDDIYRHEAELSFYLVAKRLGEF